MLAWCGILFIMGALAFMDTLFNYGALFRVVNSVILMLISLGLFVRVSMKIKMRRFEGLVAKVEQLEAELGRYRDHEHGQAISKKMEKSVS